MDKLCSNCLNGLLIPTNNDILCSEKGPVSADYLCSKHKLNPDLESSKTKKYVCCDCDNFILNTSASSQSFELAGYCNLFTVREFDGKKRKACSRFTLKTELEET